MPPKSYLLGDGVLTLGEVGTAVDFAAQVEAARVAWSMEQGDRRPVLSGEELAGDITWTATLSATFLQDLSTDGIVDFTWSNKGVEVPVSFTPNSDEGRTITGTVTMTPIDVGGDVKTQNSSDVEWTFVGDPVLGPVVP